MLRPGAASLLDPPQAHRLVQGALASRCDRASALARRPHARPARGATKAGFGRQAPVRARPREPRALSGLRGVLWVAARGLTAPAVLCAFVP